MPYVNPLSIPKDKIAKTMDIVIWAAIIGFLIATAFLTVHELMMAIVAVGFPIIIVYFIFRILKK